MLKPRKAIEVLADYHPPEEGRVGKLRLDFNENTVGCSTSILRALRRALSREWLACYPEYKAGRRRLARHFGVSPEEMLITNGVDDAIKLICDTFVNPGDSLVIPSPTFSMYPFFQEVAGGKVKEVPYGPGLRLSPERLLSAVSRGTRWIALANPNNPTGTLIPQRDLETILRGAPDALVFVDEAYFEFSGETLMPWIGKFSNLVVGRSFSKAVGLPSLRIGFLFANAKLAGLLRRAHAVFAVSSVAMAGALAAVEHQKTVREYAQEIIASRALFCRQLDKMEIDYAPSAANFVLVRIGPRCAQVALALRRRGILVRDWPHDRRLRSCLRVTVGTKAQMRRLMQELTEMQHLVERRTGRDPWDKLRA